AGSEYELPKKSFRSTRESRRPSHQAPGSSCKVRVSSLMTSLAVFGGEGGVSPLTMTQVFTGSPERVTPDEGCTCETVVVCVASDPFASYFCSSIPDKKTIFCPNEPPSMCHQFEV